MSFLELGQAAARRAEARKDLDSIVPPLSDPLAESIRIQCSAKLRLNPLLSYVVESRERKEGGYIIAFACREGTCELLIPTPRDPFEFAQALIGAMDRVERREKSERSEKRGGE